MPPMTGRMIMPQHVREFLNPALSTELFYSMIIIVCSLMIYIGTKQLYELSQHKGIKYFRQSFLFFAIAYFFRSSIKLIINYFRIEMILDLDSFAIAAITLTLFIYFSTMAIFYLLYSVMWKKWKNGKVIILAHVISAIIAIAITWSQSPIAYLLLNLFLLIIVLFTVNNSKNKKHNLQIIYTLLSFFWILNILDILIPNFLQLFQLIVYIASSIIFLVILYKVLKKSGDN